MLTKADEKKALEKIEKILVELEENAGGKIENSYILTAFAGCLEDARDNIENDFMNSWKERAELWEAKAEREHHAMLEEAERADRAEARQITKEDARQIAGILQQVQNRAAAELAEAEKTICEYCETPNESAFINAVVIRRKMKRQAQEATAILERLPQ